MPTAGEQFERCTVATQANCPNFLTNSYCNLGTLLCECPVGYTATATDITCEYNCGNLTDPDNGAVTTPDGTHTGDVAQYTCVSTFKVVGTATRTCQQDTGWDGAAPTCEPSRQMCTRETDNRGTIWDYTLLGMEVNKTCGEGFTGKTTIGVVRIMMKLTKERKFGYMFRFLIIRMKTD
ncbi:complement component receptor 1-like protein [Ruditapes philippinarum]|uniref:complement component receptor 1-like protein n=1 Tax=Ruditapes philippinarum TaxID=129788 RepID=UPI00295ABC2C|nr:complement component receptor 1-like protein [Ruditapes philippinarum]